MSQRVHLQCLGGVHYNLVRVVALYSFLEDCEESERNFLDKSDDRLNVEQEVEEFEIATASSSINELPCMHQVIYSCTVVVKILETSVCAVFDTGAKINLITDSTQRICSSASNLHIVSCRRI